jgi:uncharacterized protein (DUF3084 family)
VASREAKLAEREGQLSQMLKGLDERSKEIAAREKNVALREQAASAIEQAPAPAADLRDPKSMPRAGAIEKKHAALLADLESRGLLISDLPPEFQTFNADIFAARRLGDAARAWDLLGQLSKALARLKVDHHFVEQKMLRLQGARRTAKLSEPQKNEVEKLLRDVTADFSDGRYQQANKGLNRIAVILDAGATSG